MTAPNPLQQLRNAMKKANIAAFIVPTEDAHQSEYIAKCDSRREYISNFTGSAGTCVVTAKEACLWTDGRYYLQASQQLSKEWKLQKFGLPSTPSKEDWLLKVLEPKSRVAVDPKLITFVDSKILKEKLTSHGHELVSLQENLVDGIWPDRPAPPSAPLLVLDTKYAGQDHHEKIKFVQKELETSNAWGLLVSALDDIAWLFNLRGSDIQFNPVFHSYALITSTEVTLYVDSAKVTPQVKSHLGSVLTKPYEQVFADLKATKASEKVLLIDSRCSLALVEAYGPSKPLHLQTKPVVQYLKAIKNPTEQQGFRDCHKRDASALIRYLAWLEMELETNTTLTEAQGADKLESFRSKLDKFQGLSFDTISSTGPNGAIIHYKPEHGTCATIRKDQMYLVDSGGQYLDGTTDVTRTLHFGNPRDEEKDAFTRVLKGHIQLDMARFPQGTTGFQLDTLARTALWQVGLDYRHGTGHGVGSFLNVHEGPQSISFKENSNKVALQAGMTVTNEPGFYKDGEFGIRIENVLLVQKAETRERFGDIDYLGFEAVTLVPIQTKLVKKDLLTGEEQQWLNNYHKRCWEVISPYLKGDSDDDRLALEWLKRETRAI